MFSDRQPLCKRQPWTLLTLNVIVGTLSELLNAMRLYNCEISNIYF